ncbi:hypothetical protein COV16_06380 [Candidatus Woesearchaeota archaeon CG10_big_fil_rev_8_21_14_0_10_34_8]|nr:MAG: hypothetical protein COV16_06380 [Candidatus Woesearchaeota archaeon CG10_big_fil_rev_8_21_14_0_10_34_8]
MKYYYLLLILLVGCTSMTDKDLLKIYSNDIVHPNAFGHMIAAERLQEMILREYQEEPTVWLNASTLLTT